MSNFTYNEFKPPFWLANAHLQTILPKFVAPNVPIYRRELIKDSLNESEVAYDFYDANDLLLADDKYNKPLVVLFHGMEGSSDSHYARTLAYAVHQQGWHFVVAHFRSCGGVPVKGTVFYDAGDTAEVEHALQYLAQKYSTIYGVGVSLGGNALAKYMSDYGQKAICAAAVVASAPVDLISSSLAMERFIGRRIYTPYLLNPIIQKAIDNNLSDEEVKAIKATSRISEFDNIFTAPRHGYRSKNDYYNKASALPHLIHIAKPTLMISAKDDPFLGATATGGDVSKSVTLLDTKHGGHIGFLDYQDRKFNLEWLPKTAISFFKDVG
ncbi:YheT family hydrolase [Psychrobacter urativorans]|uniref:YheT family hydrolase n=1 Tax=Psychrobacter urativorans TaxID=45610 RepID=UPI00191A5C8E|nr:alpha/beta fold hydrolase [Psychrobacter urativorans]